MISFLQEGSARSSTISLKMTCIAPSSKLHSSWGASAAPAAEHTIMTASGEAQHEAGKKRHIALVPHEPVDTNRDMLFRREGGLVVAHHASTHLPPPSCPPRTSRKEKGKVWKNPCLPFSYHQKIGSRPPNMPNTIMSVAPLVREFCNTVMSGNTMGKLCMLFRA